MNKPVSLVIEDAISAKLNGLRKADSYNFDWRESNIPDLSLSDEIADKTYSMSEPHPNAIVTIGDETSDDYNGGKGQDVYSIQRDLTVLIRGDSISVNEVDPVRECKRYLEYAMDDVKKALGNMNFFAIPAIQDISYVTTTFNNADNETDSTRNTNANMKFSIQYQHLRSVPSTSA